jgi:hypothetical protein
MVSNTPAAHAATFELVSWPESIAMRTHTHANTEFNANATRPHSPTNSQFTTKEVSVTNKQIPTYADSTSQQVDLVCTSLVSIQNTSTKQPT